MARGLPDRVPVAAVQLNDGADQDEAPKILRAFLRERLSPYQVPTEILVVNDLPRTPSMKVNQPDVRRLFQQPSPDGSGLGG